MPTPVIPLADAPGERSTWNRPFPVVLLWAVAELLFVYNPWQISSALRAFVLRSFGARIGDRVIIRPRLRVRFPWRLSVGDDCWIGEGVWIHNQDDVIIGSNVVVSQETFMTTGSHAHRKDMSLITRPIRIDDGVWITSRCMILGGTHMRTSSLAAPMSVVAGEVPENTIVRGNPAQAIGTRFNDGGVRSK
ncbi:acetyltransferase [Curtobacterium sp. ISL-83]|uniref:acetyltransferase n=1 Tax=Curtobacterium sp. ISL-83 TaxID=2819145 RepID=UPI0027DF1CE4|nr:acetyltransferase [Curtobacterium sp. ISL-83]